MRDKDDYCEITRVSEQGGVFCCRFDPEWTVVQADESLFRFLGYTRKEFRSLFDNKMAGVIYPDDLAPMFETVERQLQDGNVIFNENRLICKDGCVKWIWVSAALMENEEYGKYFYCMFHDISERKQTQWQLEESIQNAREQASHDSLTALYNRRTTEELIDQYLRAEEGPAALMVIDVDNFKGVNDTLGHSYGDVVLSNTAFQLRKLFRDEDVVGRVGGDEFVVFIKNIGDPEEVACQAERVVELFHRSLPDYGLRYDITGSVGIALYPEDGTTYRELFQKADIAMYDSKNNGKGRYTMYDLSITSSIGTRPMISTEFDETAIVPKNIRGNTIEYVFRIFQENQEIDRAIPILLDLVGNLYHLRRVYIYESAGVSGYMICTYEWRDRKTPPLSETQRKISCRALPEEAEDVFGFFLYNESDREAVNEEACENWFTEWGVKAGMLYPVRDAGQMTALIGFELCDASRLPGVPERYDLSMTSEAISLILMRTRKQEQLQEEQSFSSRLLSQISACIYGVDPETYEILFVNSSQRCHLELHAGEFCYSKIRGRNAPCEDCPMKLLRPDRPFAVKELYYPKMGRWSETSASWFEWKGKRKVGLICSHDITQYRAERARIEFLNQNIPGGMMGGYMEPDLPVYFINDRMLQYLGYADKQEFLALTGGKLVNCIHEKDRRRVLHEIDVQLDVKGEYEIIYRMLKKDGSYIWVRDIGKPTQAENGKQAVVSVCMDVTVQIELQEELAHSEERYRIALGQTNTNVWEYDIASRTLTVTDSARAAHSYAGQIGDVPESLIRDGHIHPISQEDFRTMYRKLFDGEKRVQADILTRKPDSDDWWWERITYTNIFDENGQPVRAVAVGEDITNQKEADIRYQQELQMRYTLSENVIASSRANLTKNRIEMLQRQSSPVEIAPGGMTYDQMCRIGFETIANANDRKRYNNMLSREALQNAFARGQHTVTVEYRRKGQDGKLTWVSATTRIVKDALTGDLYAYGSIRDINVQKMLELALLRRAQKDARTNSYNKETSMHMMEDAFLFAGKSGRNCALLIFSVDNFSRLIGKNGYETIEAVLCELSDLLHLKCEKDQIVGRFYKDELGAFIGDDPKPALLLEMARDICRTISKPYMFADAPEPVNISAGIAFSDGRVTDFHTLYEQAHIALGVARYEEEGHCVIYSDQMWEERPHEQEDRPEDEPGLDDGTEQEMQRIYRCAFSLASTPELEEAVRPVMKELAEYYGAARAYLVLPGEDNRTASFCEWHSVSIPAKQTLPTRYRRPGTISQEELQRLKQQVMLESLDSLKDEIELYKALEGQGIHSIYAASLVDREGQAAGYLGMDNPNRNLKKLKLVETVRRLLENELIKRRMERRQEYLSYHDGMTGLLNRNSFADYSRTLHEESLISMGVASADINGLKMINNRYGSEFGDEIIRKTARNLQEAFSENLIYRFAGDEFLVICENLTQETFHKRISMLKEKMEEVSPSCLSVGYVWADGDIQLEKLIGCADERMLVAKQEYYSRQDTFTKGYDPLIYRNLLDGIAKGSYRMFLQPKASVETGAVVGAEALVRYWDPAVGIVGPDKFVPALEREGLIRYIDLFIFEEVCRTLSEWKERHLRTLTVSLNFSRATLLYENLVENMEQIRQRYKVAASSMEIEITESMGELEHDTLVRLGRQIRELGYRLSMDDFGAKYSNLATLSLIELDVLKLDKSLVNDLLSNPRTRILLRDLLKTCRELGIEGVAEGVETAEQLQILREMECTYVQGYYINKPIPRADFEQLYLREGYGGRE